VEAQRIRRGLTSACAAAETGEKGARLIAGALAAHGLCHEVACLLGSELVTNAATTQNSRLRAGPSRFAVTGGARRGPRRG